MIVEAEAREELFAAAAWYEDQREGLGAELLEAVDAVLARVAEVPVSFAPDQFDSRARRAVMPRFPYAIVFVVDGSEIRVVAFAHSKRLPGYWRTRV